MENIRDYKRECYGIFDGNITGNCFLQSTKVVMTWEWFMDVYGIGFITLHYGTLENIQRDAEKHLIPAQFSGKSLA